MAAGSDADDRFSVAIASLRPAVAYARRRGVDPDPVLAGHDLDGAALADVDLRISQRVYNQIVATLAIALDDAAFGLHLAELDDVGSFHVVGHLVARSSTIGEALARLVRYSAIVHDAGRVEVERDGDQVRIYPGCRGLIHDMPRQVAEYAAASVVIQLRRLAGRAATPFAVELRHPAPASTREHRRIFGVTPAFDRPETVVVVGGALLDLPIAGADPSLASLLERYAGDVLARLAAPDGLVEQVEQVIARRLEDGLDIADAARALGMSTRTLQRRLGEAETSFQALVESVRRQLAERYVGRDELSLHEVAYLLGYADPSNFHRAFRRWFGATPGAWRARRPG